MTRFARRLYLIATLAGCRATGTSQVKILGGVADDHSFPATVQVSTSDSHGLSTPGSCTGTFIRDDLLLTAGHCFISPDRSATRDQAQVYDSMQMTEQTVALLFNGKAQQVYPPGTTQDLVPVSATIHIHPAYLADGSQIWADLAVVTFAKATAPAKKVAKISTNAPRPGDEVNLVGYGITGSDQAPPQRVLGWNHVVPNTTLLKSDMAGIVFTDPRILNMLRLDGKPHPLAQEHLANGDHGDSGGPVYNAVGELVGTTEWGGAKTFPGVEYSCLYTNLVAEPEVAAFIKAALGDSMAPATVIPVAKK